MPPNPELDKYNMEWHIVQENPSDFVTWTALLSTAEKLVSQPPGSCVPDSSASLGRSHRVHVPATGPRKFLCTWPTRFVTCIHKLDSTPFADACSPPLAVQCVSACGLISVYR